jgi:hypothetical protein
MDQHVTREILWNIPVGFVVFLHAMLIPLAAAVIYVGRRWYRIVRLGAPATRPRFDQPWRRAFMSFRDGVGQGFVGRESWGWMHYAMIVRVRRPLYRHDDHLLQRPGRRGGRFFRFPQYLVGIIEVR